MNDVLNKIVCPVCRQNHTWTPNNQFRPFCSDRCRLIDLGDWADGKHHIPTDENRHNEADDEI